MTEAPTDSRPTSKQAPWFLVVIGIIPLLLLTAVLLYQHWERQREQHLREHGQPAVAEILSMRETGNVYNRKPEVRMMLRVEPSVGAAFVVEVKQTLQLTELVKYVEGSFVELLYDADNPHHVVLGKVVKRPELPQPSANPGSQK